MTEYVPFACAFIKREGQCYLPWNPEFQELLDSAYDLAKKNGAVVAKVKVKGDRLVISFEKKENA